MKALVTGGTGTLGRLVVPRLQDAGCEVRVLSRHRRESSGEVEFVTGDLASGQGVQAAAQGAEIVVHCAGSRKGTRTRPATSYRPLYGPARVISSTSRSSGPIGSR